MRFASNELNEFLTNKLAEHADVAIVANRHDVLHQFWNVPVSASELSSSSSPVRFEMPEAGGYWKPSCVSDCSKHNDSQNCSVTATVTVLVPYRARQSNLAVFLPWMHTLLQDQQREYRIVLVEQSDSLLFNRAKLFNVAFNELHKLRLQPVSCFVLHDIDKMPEDTRHVYQCGSSPRHLIAYRRDSVDKQRVYTSGRVYGMYFGGVSAMTSQQYLRVNGMSNSYFGWGAEDDDLSMRIKVVGMTVDYATSDWAKYVVLEHHNDMKMNNRPMPAEDDVRKTMELDGLNSLNYSAKVSLEPLYTHIRAYL
jgi:hypothetical protein